MSDGFEEFDALAGGDPLKEAEGDDAPEGTERRIGVFPNPNIDESPVFPLGFDGPHCLFAMPEGEIRRELASKIASLLRTDIFACEAGQAFLVNWRDGDDKFQKDLAAVWFVRACRRAGKWDSSRPLRSLGVWPGEGGAIVLHKGDEIWEMALKPKRRVAKLPIGKALRQLRGPVWQLRAPTPAPELKKPATRDDGEWICRVLDFWRFEPIGDEGLTGLDLVSGWIMAALLGAVSPFRAHLLVYAMAGSGKTTFLDFVHSLISAISGDVLTKFSEPGLRADIAGMARPLQIDEAEGTIGTNGPGPIEAALGILNDMATGAGATRVQGDGSGGVMTQTAVGAVMLAAINPPKLPPALASRVAELRLLPLESPRPPGDAARPIATRAQLVEAIAKAKALAPALLGRALAGSWRFLADRDHLEAAILRTGVSPRTADLVATLAAGRRLMRFDAPLDPATADEEVRLWEPLLVERSAREAVTNPGEDALAHLLNWSSGQHYNDRQLTLGDQIRRWLNLGDRDLVHDILKNHGVRLWIDDQPGRAGPWMMVANEHPALDKIFKGTPWGDWRRALSYLDALGPEFKTDFSKGPQWFGMVKKRGICIPLTPWIEPGRPSRSTTVPTNVPGDDVEW